MSDSIQHTPGPWKCGPSPKSDSAFERLWWIGPTVGFCDVAVTDNNKYRSAEETAANAHLIAAAPELLAALKRLVAAEDASIDEFTAKEIEEIEAAMQQARAAITRVTLAGGQA